jgi:hypothetical protein
VPKTGDFPAHARLGLVRRFLPAPHISGKEASQVRNGWSDEQLLAALSEAMKARQAVPSWFVESGKNACAWHHIGTELAQHTRDGRWGPSAR